MSDLKDWFNTGDVYGNSHDWRCNHVVKNPTTHERSTNRHCTACWV